MTQPSHFSALFDAIAQSGFALRGAFHCGAEDRTPDGVASVVLVGNIGSRGFERFRRSAQWGMSADPLDRYTEAVIGAIARRFDAGVVYPWQGPPWWPFQRWAMRAEAVSVSPLQILIHPRHGLWHAYRAALLFNAPVTGLPVRPRAGAAAGEGTLGQSSPCAQCTARPCLAACPVDAFAGGAFDRDRCERHLRSPAGQSCLDEGCAARNACPVAPQTRYSREQRQFHMRAFVNVRADLN